MKRSRREEEARQLEAELARERGRAAKRGKRRSGAQREREEMSADPRKQVAGLGSRWSRSLRGPAHDGSQGSSGWWAEQGV